MQCFTYLISFHLISFCIKFLVRTMDGGEPDIPIYKVIECMGPTNTRVYTVAVYFRGKRLASSSGHSIQQAEMKAAKAALENSAELFPQLDYQKRVIAQSIQRQKGSEFSRDNRKKLSPRKHTRNPLDDESNLPKQYRTREDISSDELDITSSDEDDVSVKSVEINDLDSSSPKSEEKEETMEKEIDECNKQSPESATDSEVLLVSNASEMQGTEHISDDDMSDASLESGEIL